MLAEFLLLAQSTTLPSPTATQCSHDAEIVKAAQPPWDADMGRPTEDLFCDRCRARWTRRVDWERADFLTRAATSILTRPQFGPRVTRLTKPKWQIANLLKARSFLRRALQEVMRLVPMMSQRLRVGRPT